MGLCSRTIRENNYECDDFLTYVCFEMFKRKQFDRVILTYLANYYCGATTDMKLLWREAREYEVHTQKLGGEDHHTDVVLGRVVRRGSDL